MGIDPGLATTGWGIVSRVGQHVQLVAYGTILTKSDAPLEKRLLVISQDMKILLRKYRPGSVAVEQLFFNTNAKTALIVGHARGVVILAATEGKFPFFSYTPLQVKMAVTGFGRADKRQMQEMVKKTLKLDVVPKPDDAADALAIALTHVFTVRFE